MSIKRNKTNAIKMLVLSSAAVVISLLTVAICIFANSNGNPYLGMDKMDFGPKYQLQELNTIEGVAMAKADTIDLYKEMGVKDSIDLNGLENVVLKSAQDLNDPNNAQVPEPATITLLTLGGLAILRKKRKNAKK